MYVYTCKCVSHANSQAGAHLTWMAPTLSIHSGNGEGTEAPPVKAPPLASSLPNAFLSYFQVLSLLHPPGGREPPVLLPELRPNPPGCPKAGPTVRLGSRKPKRAGGPCRALPLQRLPKSTRNPGLSFPLSHVLSCHLSVWMRGAAGHMATNLHP